MATAAKENKEERMVTRLTRAQKNLFERAAALEGQSVATFVLTHALKAAEERVHRLQMIELNAEQSLKFAEALLAPPKPPSKRFKEASALYRKTVIEK